MSNDAEYSIDLINKHLVGSTITGAVRDKDDFDTFFGLRVEKDGKEFGVWINQDAEGNGPGWIDIQEIK